jgi:G3E family GTPase
VHDDDEISSFLLEAGEVDLERIGTFVQSLIDELGDELLRYKGILAISDEDRKLIFQGCSVSRASTMAKTGEPKRHAFPGLS